MQDLTLEILRCPACARELERGPRVLRCKGCGAQWPTDGVAPDLVEDAAQPSSLGGRAMQSKWVARIYEAWWRPVLFRLFGGPNLPGQDREVALVLERLADMPGPWLDLSCGPGNVTHRLERSGRQLIGVDLSHAMLTQAQRRVSSAFLVRAEAERLPFEPGTFGAVINLAALDLYPDASRVVLESARVLKHGGRWIASTFVSPNGLVRRRGLRNVVASITGIYAMTAAGLADWVAAAGLTGYHEIAFGNYLLAWADKPAAAGDA